MQTYQDLVSSCIVSVCHLDEKRDRLTVSASYWGEDRPQDGRIRVARVHIRKQGKCNWVITSDRGAYLGAGVEKQEALVRAGMICQDELRILLGK